MKKSQTAKSSADDEERLRKAADLDKAFADYDDDKFDRLTNKQMMEVIADAMDGALKANSELVKQELTQKYQEDIKRFDEVEKATMGIIAHMGLSEARKKHPDFDQFKEDIGKVMTQYPNIGYDDAYLIAKSRKAGSVPPRSNVESERPDSFGTAPTSRRTSSDEGDSPMNEDAFAKMAARGRQSRGRSAGGDEQDNRSGIVGFRALANDALDRMLESE